MRRSTERCDEIIDLIDRCLAEVAVDASASSADARRRDRSAVVLTGATAA